MAEKTKEAIKLEAEAKAKAEAEAKAKLEAEAKAKAEAEAKALAEAEKEEKTPSDKAPKEKKSNIRRVFRVIFFRDGVPFKEKLVTLLQRKSIIAGTEIPELSRSILPNPQNQYVLAEGEIEYDEQLKSLRRWESGEANGGIPILMEINPKLEGTPWISEKAKEIKALEDKIRKLKASA